MKKIYQIMIICVGCIIGACSQDVPAPEDVFIKYYGKQGIQTAKGLAATSRGEFIILASQKLDGDTTGINFYLIKTDQAGNELRSITYNYNNSTNDDVPVRIKAVGNDEFLIIGTSISSNGLTKRLIYARINSDLDFLPSGGGFYELSSESMVGSQPPYNLEGNDIVQVEGQNGEVNYIILGTAESAGGSEIYLSKWDDAGSRVWVEDNYIGFAGNDRGLAVFEKPDGKLLIVGSTENSRGDFTGTNISIFITNEFGSPDENGFVTGISGADSGADDIPHDIIRKSSDTYVIVGATTLGNRHVPFQMQINPSGVIAGQYVLATEFTGNACQGLGVTRTLSNEYIVVGKYPNFSFGEESKLGEMMVMRTNQFGERIAGYDRNYGLVSGDDEANAVITAADGDVVVAATVDFGSGTKLVGLLKLNEFGELKD